MAVSAAFAEFWKPVPCGYTMAAFFAFMMSRPSVPHA